MIGLVQQLLAALGSRGLHAQSLDDVGALVGRLLFQVGDLGIQLLDLIVLRGQRNTQIGKLAAQIGQTRAVVAQRRIVQYLGHGFGGIVVRNLHLGLGIGLVYLSLGQVGLNLAQLIGRDTLLRLAGNYDTRLPRVVLQIVFRILQFLACVVELGGEELVGVAGGTAAGVLSLLDKLLRQRVRRIRSQLSFGTQNRQGDKI